MTQPSGRRKYVVAWRGAGARRKVRVKADISITPLVSVSWSICVGGVDVAYGPQFGDL